MKPVITTQTKIVISFTTIAEKMVLGWEGLHCNFKTDEARRGARNKVSMKELKGALEQGGQRVEKRRTWLLKPFHLHWGLH